MKIRMFFAGLLLVASASSAFAAGPYIGAAGGVSIFHDSDVSFPGEPNVTASYDTGFGFNVNAGYNFDFARIEGEFGYKAADVDSFSALGFNLNVGGADATIMSYMINGYYDIKTQTPLTPYIGAGIGAINAELNDNFGKNDDTVFGYQLIAGVGYKIDNNLTIDLSYRFQATAEDIEIDGTKVDFMNSNIYAGVRYNF